MVRKFGSLCLQEFWFLQNRSYVRLHIHISGCEMAHLLAGSPRHTAYFSHLTCYWTCYGQLTTVKQRYLLTIVTLLYRGLRYTTHRGDVSFEVISRPAFSFQLIAGSGPSFKGRIHFTFCLRQKLSYLRKTFLSRSLESFAFGLG